MIKVLGKASKDSERGAIAIITVIIIMALIGFGAVAVDVGQVYAERAQLQNGADSAALGIAQQCYKAGTCSAADAMSWAQPLVNGNANDGATTVKAVDLSVANQVTVTTTTLDGTTNAGFLTPLLRQAVGGGPITVAAQATAKWGPPGGGSGFPLALSDACFDLSSGSNSGQMQVFSYKPGNGSGSTPTNMTCTNASGQTTAGGWGWLQESSTCSVTTSAGGTVGSNTGNNPASDCSSLLQGWINTLSSGGKVEVQFPVFSQTAYTGNNAQYTILGYATLSIVGWQFSGTGQGNLPFWYNSNPPTGYPTLSCGGSDRCIIGQFVRFDASVQSTGGNGQDFGTSAFYLSK